MPSTYTPIATTTLGSAAADVTFSSISSAYTDLVLIVNARLDAGIFRDASVALQFNSDTSTNYSNTALNGDGSTASSFRVTSQSQMLVGTITEIQCTTIAQIMNYANTTTSKTVLGRGNGTNARVRAYVGLWRATPAAITSIKVLNNDTYNFATGSTFTLYGVKSA
jgi:hypothetical protein